MAVPYTFGTATASIPLSQLDSNFATVITLGNTAIQLGNTVTTLNNMTLANVTISSGNVTITNVAITTANVTTANITTAVIGTETVTTSTITTANVTTANITTDNITNGTVITSLTLSYGTANGVAYLNGSKVLTTGSALTFDGTNFSTTGTATAAKLIPTGSSATGNGLYLPAANSVGISTNGTNAVYIDSTQNVGIGTSLPAQKLQVAGKAILGAYANTGAYGLYLRSDAQSTHYNWQISTQNTVNGGFEIARSDAVGSSTFNSPSVIIDSSGNAIIGGTSADGFRLKVQFTGTNGLRLDTTSTSATLCVQFVYNASTQVGTIATTTTSTAYNTSSDYRLKENVQPMTGALAKVGAFKPVTYTWKADGSDGEGFIAHELAEVCPNAVSGEKDAVDENGNIKPQGIDTSFLVATLTAAIQEQQALITSLTARITALESKEIS
jgi:hypothetical protein